MIASYQPKKKAVKRVAKELYRNYVRSCNVSVDPLARAFEVKRWRDVLPDWKDYYLSQAKRYLLENSMNLTAV